MALEEYRRKRDFRKTPEPPPDQIPARGKQLSYLIQKHDATRLHYDFRLELDGVLLSWAVTKGPSLDPADKRLAVRTEDHPLSYGKFEGTIPKGQYGGGTVMLWDEGSWKPEGDPHAGLEKGHLSFELFGNRLKGRWTLIRIRGGGKRENWLLIKRNDAEAAPGQSNEDFLEESSVSVKTNRTMAEISEGRQPANQRKAAARPAAELERLGERYPDVQLATLVDKAPTGDAWVHEIKLDGYRLLGFAASGQARLRTRNGNDWTDRFPAIDGALQKLKADSAVIDMEAVLLDSGGRSSFQALQGALGDGGHPERIVGYAFDILELDGKDLTGLPLTERKETLQNLLKRSKLEPALHYSEHLAVDGKQMHLQACDKGLEGIISKLANAPYVAGRQKSWLKVKCTLRQEFIIVGYSLAKSGGRALGALYLGYRRNGELRYAGKVGTGFSMESAGDLIERFAGISSAEPVLPRAEAKSIGAAEWSAVKWLKPVLICDIRFTEWTQDGRIRHPSFQGLREDKDATDVRQEKPAKVAAQEPAAKTKNGALVLEGIRITHPDRVISETDQVTKGELAEYYAAVAPFMLPHIVKHPLSLLRCPSGIDDGECFYQRSPGRGLGKDVYSFDFRHKGKRYEYLYIKDAKGLLEVVQMGAVEIHPWGAPVDAIDFPDRLIFDLDPAPDIPFEALKLAAQDLRQRLRKKGLDATLKCTGGKGLHITVALAGKDKWPDVKSFAATLAGEMIEAAPQAYVATMTKSKRTGKIFIDYFRNDYTATAIADYGVRARPGAPVAVPLAWTELKTLKAADQFKMKDVIKRLRNRKPPARAKGQVLPR